MRELTSNQKGAIAESAIELAATRAHLGIYRPASGHSRADLVFEIGNDLYRVQVKWGRLSPAQDCIIVHTGGFRLSSHGAVRTTYSEQ